MSRVRGVQSENVGGGLECFRLGDRTGACLEGQQSDPGPGSINQYSNLHHHQEEH